MRPMASPDHDRLRAQQSQYRRLEKDNEWLIEAYQNTLARAKRLEKEAAR